MMILSMNLMTVMAWMILVSIPTIHGQLLLWDMPNTIDNDYQLALPSSYINPKDLPKAFSWGNVDGISYLTRSLNQHLPQYVCIIYIRQNDSVTDKNKALKKEKILLPVLVAFVCVPPFLFLSLPYLLWILDSAVVAGLMPH